MLPWPSDSHSASVARRRDLQIRVASPRLRGEGLPPGPISGAAFRLGARQDSGETLVSVYLILCTDMHWRAT